MGDEPIIIEQFFYGFEGVIMGSIIGSQNIMGSNYGSNISDSPAPQLGEQDTSFSRTPSFGSSNPFSKRIYLRD